VSNGGPGGAGPDRAAASEDLRPSHPGLLGARETIEGGLAGCFFATGRERLRAVEERPPGGTEEPGCPCAMHVLVQFVLAQVRRSINMSPFEKRGYRGLTASGVPDGQDREHPPYPPFSTYFPHISY
jgi:hypothetical protein